jgi:hypothetical protein
LGPQACQLLAGHSGIAAGIDSGPLSLCSDSICCSGSSNAADSCWPPRRDERPERLGVRASCPDESPYGRDTRKPSVEFVGRKPVDLRTMSRFQSFAELLSGIELFMSDDGSC